MMWLPGTMGPSRPLWMMRLLRTRWVGVSISAMRPRISPRKDRGEWFLMPRREMVVDLKAAFNRSGRGNWTPR